MRAIPYGDGACHLHVSGHFSGRRNLTADKQKKSSKKRIVYYSQPRTDGAGAFIQDMLFAHAYVFSLNKNDNNDATFVYGGACSWFGKQSSMHKTKAVLKGIGTLKELPLVRKAKKACKDESNIISPKVYRKENFVHSLGWLKCIHSSIEHKIRSKIRPKASKHQHKTVVHIRRGDIGPCSVDKVYSRYLPNSYYLETISKYVPPNSTTHIISLENLYENYTIFSEYLGPKGPVSNKNLSLEIDLNPTKTTDQIWVEMMTADVVIISRSSYSYVPALLNINPNVQVIYTPFWHSKLPNWTMVDEEIRNHTDLASLKICQQK